MLYRKELLSVTPSVTAVTGLKVSRTFQNSLVQLCPIEQRRVISAVTEPGSSLPKL